MSKKRIFFISNITNPRPQSKGGDIIVYRHLIDLLTQGYEVIIVNSFAKSPKNTPFTEINLKRRWWFPPGSVYKFSLLKLRIRLLKYLLLSKIKIQTGDIILGIAGEYLNLLILDLKKECDCKLALFYHDEGIFTTPLKPEIKKEYINLLNKANIIFAVSEEMIVLLKQNNITSNLKLLYPIPEGNPAMMYAKWKDSFLSNYKISYLGSILPLYHEEVLGNINKAISGTNIFLDVYSNKTKNDFQYEYDSINFFPFLNSNEEVKQKLVNEYWLNVVFYSFDAEKEFRMLTSFPSKFCEFVHTGIPILIIAPVFSTIGKWALKNQWLAYCPDQSPSAINAVLLSLQEKSFWEACAAQSQRAAKEYFNPENIHETFKKYLEI